MERFNPAPTTSLREIARLLANDRLNRVVAGYSERQACLRRVAFLVLVTAWAGWWAFLAGPPTRNNTLPIEAAHLMPWVPLLLWLASVWALGIRRGWIPASDRVDTAGAIANVLGIGIMLHLAWNISISMIAVLPFTTILVGARMGRHAFLVCMGCTVMVVALAAPPGYWMARPAFVPFALLLLCGLPMTVNRLLALLAEVSRAALASRDAQGRFLATMSHELRTPLNTVIHASALIDSSRLSPQDRESLRAVQLNARSLLQRVNDVLDVAAISAGRFGLVREPFVLARVVQQAYEMMRPLAESRRQEITLEEAMPPGLCVLGDANRLEQVLTNLLGNAIKFTPEDGRVGLRVSLDGERMLFEVEDSGPGIPDADKQRIFEPFVQVSEGHTRREDGVGLGLHIVQRFARHARGSITVADRARGGSVFRLELPLLPAPQEVLRPDEADTLRILDEHRRSVRSRRCLVVDDNEANRQVVTRLLDRAGHRVQTACDGGQALARLQCGERYDLLLLDVHMPGVSGLDLLRSIAETPPASAPRVFMLSADSDPTLKARALALGARGYLTKPIVLEQLLAAVGAPDEPIPAGAGADPAGGRISIDLMRSLGTPEDVRRYIELGRRELERLERSLLEGGTAMHSTALLHELKNVFLALGDRDGESLCNRLRDAQGRDVDEAAAREALQQHIRGAREALQSELGPISP